MAQADGAPHHLHPATITLQAPFGFRLRSCSWFLGRISAGLAEPLLLTFYCSKGLWLIISDASAAATPPNRYAAVYIASNIGAPEDWPPNYPSTIECPTPMALHHGSILNLYQELRKLRKDQKLVISVKPIANPNQNQIRGDFLDQNTNPPTLYMHQWAYSCPEWPVIKDKLSLSINMRELHYILDSNYFGTLTEPFKKVTPEQRGTVELELTQGYDDEKETQVYHLSIILPGQPNYKLQQTESNVSNEPQRLPLRMSFDLYSLRCLIDLAEEIGFEFLSLALNDLMTPFQMVVGNARVFCLSYH